MFSMTMSGGATSAPPLSRSMEHARQKRGQTRAPRVLIVEDEAIIGLELQGSVEDLGYEVVALAGTEGEAVRLAKLKKPDIALVDVRLGKGDGIEAARVMQAMGPIRIIFCTAYSRDPVTLSRMQALSPVTVLAKPLSAAQLKTALDQAR